MLQFWLEGTPIDRIQADFIDAAAIHEIRIPMHGREYRAGLHLVGNLQRQHHVRAFAGHRHQIAGMQAAPLGVVGMYGQCRFRRMRE